jgi:hypothetical protein
MFSPKKIILFMILGLFYCADTNDLYYSNGQANGRIYLAFAIKDIECKFTHRLTAFIPYEARKTEIDTCVQAILTRLCGDWNVTDPTPLSCKTINYRTNYKLGGIKK